MTTVLGILILVCALFLIISVLLQSSKNHRMSGVVSVGAIGGGSAGRTHQIPRGIDPASPLHP